MNGNKIIVRKHDKPWRFGSIEETGMCHFCNKETKWHYVLAKVNYQGVVPCCECEECGERIPCFTFDRYKQTGEVIIAI